MFKNIGAFLGITTEKLITSSLQPVLIINIYCIYKKYYVLSENDYKKKIIIKTSRCGQPKTRAFYQNLIFLNSQGIERTGCR